MENGAWLIIGARTNRFTFRRNLYKLIPDRATVVRRKDIIGTKKYL